MVSLRPTTTTPRPDWPINSAFPHRFGVRVPSLVWEETHSEAGNLYQWLLDGSPTVRSVEAVQLHSCAPPPHTAACPRPLVPLRRRPRATTVCPMRSTRRRFKSECTSPTRRQKHPSHRPAAARRPPQRRTALAAGASHSLTLPRLSLSVRPHCSSMTMMPPLRTPISASVLLSSSSGSGISFSWPGGL